MKIKGILFYTLLSIIFIITQIGCSKSETKVEKKETALVDFENIEEPSEFKIKKIKQDIYKISGVGGMTYSRSGKYLAVSVPYGFVIIPIDSLYNTKIDLTTVKKWYGKIIGFLPSDMFVYSNEGNIFLSDPQKQDSKKIFEEEENIHVYSPYPSLVNGSVVVVSNELLITGTGGADWGVDDGGNIFKYDLDKKQIIKGDKIMSFDEVMLSPSCKYIAYDHGSDMGNSVDIYDISMDKNHPIFNYFDFKNIFSDYKDVNEYLVGWIDNSDRFLVKVILLKDDSDLPEAAKYWLVLVDVPNKNIIWKNDNLPVPVNIQVINNEKAIFVKDNDIYELSLLNGEIKKYSGIVDGTLIAVSSDKKKIAFLKSNQLFITSPEENDKKLIAAVPNLEYIDIIWSPKNDSLIIVGINEIILVQISSLDIKK